MVFAQATGLRVFPMMPVPETGGRIGKVPLIRRWPKDASSDLHRIRLWAERWPWALWAAVVKGFCVLDFDRRGLLNQFLIEHRWYEPRTWIARTPRGVHLYVRLIRGAKRSIGAIRPGIDLLVPGNCVVLPLGEGARRLGYRWLRSGGMSDLIRLPPHLRKLVVSAGTEFSVGRAGVRGTRSRLRVPEVIPEGMRDDMLFRIGCSLRARGHSGDEIEEALHRANTELCRPPLPASQVDAKVRRAMRYRPGLRKASTTAPWTAAPRRKRYRWKNGRYGTLPGPEGPQSRRGHWANNRREADLDTVRCPPGERYLARSILRVLRTWKQANHWAVRISWPALEKALAATGITTSERSAYRALILLDRLELIALPPGLVLQVQGYHEHSRMIGVSDAALSDAERFVAMVRSGL